MRPVHLSRRIAVARAFATVALPAPVNSLTGVACVDRARCWAVGSTVGCVPGPRTVRPSSPPTNGGRSWSNQPIPATVGLSVAGRLQ